MIHARKSFTPDTIVLLLGLGTAIALFGDTAIYVVLPTHTVMAGILLADVGLMLSANRIIRIFLNSPLGMLIERVPRRRVLVAAQVIGAVASLCYVVTGFWPMLAGRLLWGIAWIGIWLGGNTAVLDVATRANRGRLVGRYHMWTFAGFSAGALLGGFLTDSLGYRQAFAIFTVTGLLAALIWWLFVPETKRESADEPPAIDDQPAPAVRPQLARLPLIPLVTAALITGLNWLIFLGIIGAILALLLQERIGDGLALGAWLIPLATLTGIIAAGKDLLSLLAAPVSGAVSDRLGNRWLLIVLALILGVVALSVVALSGGVGVVAGILMGAITTSILQTQTTALIGDYALFNRQGRLLGGLNTIGDIGSAAGPLLAFFLIQRGWTLGDVLLLAAAILALALPWVIWVGWRAPRPVQFQVETAA